MAAMNVKLAMPIAMWCADATSGPSAPGQERHQREDPDLGEHLQPRREAEAVGGRQRNGRRRRLRAVLARRDPDEGEQDEARRR